MKSNTQYEVHLAVPILKPTKEMQGVRAELMALGFGKVKYFHRVHDEKPITPGCMNGHDIEDPGMMATSRIEGIDESIKLVNEGMQFLNILGINGMNFEIEAISCEDLTPIRNRLTESLVQYEKVPHSPEWETHLIYKEPALPSDGEIVSELAKIGLELNQVVDFGYQPKNIPGPITRVATLYHPDKTIAHRVHQQLEGASLPHSPRLVTEEVLFVGKFKP